MQLKPPVRYLFSSPQGDIEELPLQEPLKPAGDHPAITLGEYFAAMKDFLLTNREAVETAIGAILPRPRALADAGQILLRSEKLGALYHVASAEFIFADARPKLAVITAVSAVGRAWMQREFATLRRLHEAFGLPYLPRVYCLNEMVRRAPGGHSVTVTMFLAEWLEDYHEWHLSDGPHGRGLVIWDTKKGYRAATPAESRAIYRQAAKILALYYDAGDYSQIYPWHHAAGDFVVKTTGGAVDVKLTTARSYEPLMVFTAGDALNPLVALIYFFLNLTLQMRLDKLDGVGETAWAGAPCLQATVEGFFEAMQCQEREGRLAPGQAGDLLALCQSFSRQELQTLFEPLLDLHRQRDPGDLAVIEANLREHIGELHAAMRNFRL